MCFPSAFHSFFFIHLSVLMNTPPVKLACLGPAFIKPDLPACYCLVEPTSRGGFISRKCEGKANYADENPLVYVSTGRCFWGFYSSLTSHLGFQIAPGTLIWATAKYQGSAGGGLSQLTYGKAWQPKKGLSYIQFKGRKGTPVTGYVIRLLFFSI